MKDINKLYHNDFGISFFWKCKIQRKNSLVELVFRDTGLSLRCDEIETMYLIVKSIVKKPSLCMDCKKNRGCKSLLLEIPNTKVSFAMSFQEMTEMLDLLKGTLFQLELISLIKLEI